MSSDAIEFRIGAEWVYFKVPAGRRETNPELIEGTASEQCTGCGVPVGEENNGGTCTLVRTPKDQNDDTEWTLTCGNCGTEYRGKVVNMEELNKLHEYY
jgi:hypothetical protein